MELLLNNLPTLFALIGTGIVAGLLAGLLGVGGGIVIVPILYFLFQSFGVSADSAMVIATATSLATIVPTSISSIRAHNKKGNVDFELLKVWGGFILIGVLAGSWLVTRVNGQMLTTLFGTIAMLSALNMMLGRKKPWFDSLPGKTGQAAMGSSVGLFSSLVGIGGGTLTIPMLTFCNYPAHRAVGTAAAVGLIISLPAAISMLVIGVTPPDAPIGTFGLVNFVGFICIVPLTVTFAPMGARIANKIDAQKLKKIFAFVLLLTGLRMLLQLVL
jgi:uncharacterized membrane protein YfcA